MAFSVSSKSKPFKLYALRSEKVPAEFPYLFQHPSKRPPPLSGAQYNHTTREFLADPAVYQTPK